MVDTWVCVQTHTHFLTHTDTHTHTHTHTQTHAHTHTRTHTLHTNFPLSQYERHSLFNCHFFALPGNIIWNVCFAWSRLRGVRRVELVEFYCTRKRNHIVWWERCECFLWERTPLWDNDTCYLSLSHTHTHTHRHTHTYTHIHARMHASEHTHTNTHPH